MSCYWSSTSPSWHYRQVRYLLFYDSFHALFSKMKKQRLDHSEGLCVEYRTSHNQAERDLQGLAGPHPNGSTAFRCVTQRSQSLWWRSQSSGKYCSNAESQTGSKLQGFGNRLCPLNSTILCFMYQKNPYNNCWISSDLVIIKYPLWYWCYTGGFGCKVNEIS